MGEYLSYFFKIIYHFILAGIVYNAAKNSYIKKKASEVAQEYKHKLSYRTIMLYCLLEIIYTFICSPWRVYLADRRIYALHFSIFDNAASTPGFAILCDVLWKFSNDPLSLFAAVAFLYALITCVAYNNFKEASPSFFILIGLSVYNTFGLYQFKQALASVFVALSFSFFFKGKTPSSLLIMITAVLFHETAIFTLALLLFIIFARSKVSYVVGFIALFSGMIFLKQLSSYIVFVFSDVIPIFGTRITKYFNENGELISGSFNFLTILKGAPYYIITLIGLKKRSDLYSKIDHYDKYLFICIFVSISIISSSFMYWLWRIGELAYVPVYYFWTRISCETKKGYSSVVIFSFVMLTMYQLVICYFNFGGII